MRAASASIILAVVSFGLGGCGSKNSPNQTASCSPSSIGSSPYAIHDSEPHPACTVVLSRTDAVAPETVDTTNWEHRRKWRRP